MAGTHFDRFVERRLGPANEAVGLDHATEITVTPRDNLFAPRLEELPTLISSLPGAPSREGSQEERAGDA
jgi:hypothetical protein